MHTVCSMEIVTRQQAISRGLSEYFTGKPCRNGHVAKRYLQSSTCYECIHPPAGDEKREEQARNRAEAHRLLSVKRSMVVKRFRVLHLQLPMWHDVLLGLAKMHEPSLELSDVLTERDAIMLSPVASILSFRIFPDMEPALRPLEPLEWGDITPAPTFSEPAGSDYWPINDPR